MGNNEFSLEELRCVAWIRENGPIYGSAVYGERTNLMTAAMEIDDTLMIPSPKNTVEDIAPRSTVGRNIGVISECVPISK